MPAAQHHHAADHAAWRERGCRVVEAPAGPLRLDGEPPLAVVLRGLVLQESRVHDRTSAELMADGDVLALADDGDPRLLPAVITHVVHREATLALVPAEPRAGALDGHLRRRLAAQCRRSATHLAVLHLPRIEDRIVAVFCALADRHGRATADGVVLELPLTHVLIGRLVGGRRPTVSLALSQLAESGAVVRQPGGWRIAWAAIGDRPA